MDFIHFGLRMEIEQLYLEWCEEEGIANKPNSMVVFLMEKGWLNKRKIIEDLEGREIEPNNDETHKCYKCSWWDYDHGSQTMYKMNCNGMAEKIEPLKRRK